MKHAVRIAVLTTLAAASFAPTASARPDGYSASVGSPPEVQHVGRSYTLTVRVRNSGAWVKNFCLDFEDSNNSWLIRMPGLRAWDDDTFCAGTLRAGRKQFIARIVPAKPGAKKLGVTIGSAKLYPDVNNAVITDEHALSWSDTFVIVG